MVPTSLRLRWYRGIPAATLLVAASVAHAQGAPGGTERADPLDAQARVPAVTYTSPLANYRRLGDDRPVPWKEANETVTRIGGWRAYTREAQQPNAAAAAPGAGSPLARPAAPTAAPAATPAATPAAAPASGGAPAQGGHHRH